MKSNFKKSNICIAVQKTFLSVASGFVALGTMNATAAIININDGNYITTDRSFNEDTEINNYYARNMRVINFQRGADDLYIHVASGKTLTIKQLNELSPNDGYAFYYQAGILGATIDTGKKMVFTGGNLVMKMPDTIDPTHDFQDYRTFVMASADNHGFLHFQNESVLLDGAVGNGILFGGYNSKMEFDNGFVMNLNRSQVENGYDSTGLWLQLGTHAQLDKASNINIYAGNNDTGATGVMLTSGSSLGFKDKLTVKINGNGSTKFTDPLGVYIRDNTGYDVGQDLNFEGQFDINILNAPEASGYGLYLASNRNYSMKEGAKVYAEGLKDITGFVGKTSHSIISDKKFEFDFKNISGTAKAIMLSNGNLQAPEIVAKFTDSAQAFGIQATGAAKLELGNATMTLDGTYAHARLIDAYQTSEINLKGGLVSETPSWITAWDNSTVLINSEATGVVKFAGGVQTELGENKQAKININLGNPLNSSEDDSYWTITEESILTKLAMGHHSTLNFRPEGDLTDYIIAEGKESKPILHVTGTDPVVFYDDGARKTRITLDKSWGEKLTQESNIKLIQSDAGFKLNDSDVTVGVDLGDLFKPEIVLSSTYSLARVESDILESYKYTLKFTTDKLLIATVDPNKVIVPLTPLVPATPRINPETNVLMESSLSSFGTLVAADDLLVDTVLRTRNGGHDGAFAAARAGRWHFDTSASQKSNITSGLFGYAVQTSVAEVGGWLEIGNSSYKANTTADGVVTDGSGKHNYAGVGAYANVPMPLEGLFLTGYIKAGALENNFDTMLTDQAVNFDRTSGYWGAHLGAHYDFTAGDVRLRPFVSYFYDGRDGESYSLKGHGKVQGTTFHYDKLNTHRVQAGTFAEYRYSEQQRPYIGLTYEQVLSAKAKGYAVDSMGRLDLNSSDMEGGTGILSAGWTYVNGTKDFSCEFGVNGFTGYREGVSAQIQADWKF